MALQEHRVELDRLANALLEYETLSVDEVKKVIAGKIF
jgi:ATP-dependent metalloprotease